MASRGACRPSRAAAPIADALVGAWPALSGRDVHRPDPVASRAARSRSSPPDDRAACSGEETLPEGPFGEVTGYYACEKRPASVMHVTAMHWRDDPDLLGSPRSNGTTERNRNDP
jgi:hypothetical protein